MSIRKANAVWNGTLKEGNGKMNFSNYSGPYTFASRFEEGKAIAEWVFNNYFWE